MVKEAEKYLQLMDRQYYKSYGKVVKVVGLTIESVQHCSLVHLAYTLFNRGLFGDAITRIGLGSR